MSCALLALTITLAAAATAAAQPAPWQPEERITPGWTVTPAVVFGGAWDSNVTVQGEGSPRAREVVTLVNARGTLEYTGPLTQFTAGYAGALETYREFNELNRYEQRARLEFRRKTSPRLDYYVRGGLLNSPTTDRLDLGGGAVPFIDVGSRLLSAATGVHYALGPRTHLETAYRFQDVRFDERNSEAFEFLRGGYSHSPMVMALHDITRHFSLGGSWQYTHARIDEGLQTFNIQTAGAEATYSLAAKTTMRGGAGLSYLRATHGGLTTIGPAGYGSLEHQRGRTTVRLRYDHAFTPTYTFGGVTTNRSASANVRIGFARDRGYIAAGASYGSTDPIEQIGLSFRTDSMWFDGALGYELLHWLRTEVFYNGSHQTSTARGNIDRARIGIQFVTFKPVRIR